MDEEIRYWLALRNIRGIGSTTIKRLTDHFKTPVQIFSSSTKALSEVTGVSKKIAEDIVSFKGWKEVEGEIKKAVDLGVSIISMKDVSYPKNLLNIHNPPPFLYLMGKINERDDLALAMVGSRSASHYGIEVTKKFSYRLAKAGVTVVSGMARGVDTAAHIGALEGGGKTIAVMGCGLDIVYPPENRRLFSQIAKEGVLISEFPLGTPPEAGNFPRRNRIISGLSLGVIVVEASLKSGSLITSRCALEQGRDVYAIPGNINSAKSKGTNSLIKEGARLVETPEEVLTDVLPQYNDSFSVKGEEKREIEFSLNDKEHKVFSQLGSEPLHIDDLVNKCMLDISELSSTLLSLELMGAVKQHPGKTFTKLII